MRHHDDEILAPAELRPQHDVRRLQRLGDELLDREAGGGLPLAMRGERQRHPQDVRQLARQRQRVGAQPEVGGPPVAGSDRSQVGPSGGGRRFGGASRHDDRFHEITFSLTTR